MTLEEFADMADCLERDEFGKTLLPFVSQPDQEGAVSRPKGVNLELAQPLASTALFVVLQSLSFGESFR